MSKNSEAMITPKVITWAREFCSLSIDDAAKKIGVKSTLLQKWENGECFPSIKQAYNISTIYKLPLATLWLNEPPKLGVPKIRDFRKVANSELDKFSYQLSLQIREYYFKRELFIELSENIKRKLIPFTFSLNKQNNTDILANNIRDFLGLNWETQKNWKDSRLAFNAIREIIEEKCIAVFQLTDIKVQECRGFSIYEELIPVIAINRKDSYTGRIFSLIHEFIHLCFSNSCITNLDNLDLNHEKINSEEYYINELTAAVLIPTKILSTQIEFYKNIQSIENLKKIADSFSISRESLVIRMFHLSHYNYNEVNNLLEKIRKSYKINNQKGFVSPITKLLSVYGKPMTRLLIENYNSGFIHVGDFYAYTGLKEKHIVKLQNSL